jgi:hypothetical protein
VIFVGNVSLDLFKDFGVSIYQKFEWEALVWGNFFITFSVYTLPCLAAILY